MVQALRRTSVRVKMMAAAVAPLAGLGLEGGASLCPAPGSAKMSCQTAASILLGIRTIPFCYADAGMKDSMGVTNRAVAQAFPRGGTSMLHTGRRTHPAARTQIVCATTITAARVLLLLRGGALQPGQDFTIRPGLADAPPITYTVYHLLTDTQVTQIYAIAGTTVVR